MIKSIVALSITAAAQLLLTTKPAEAGCTFSWNLASDGSRCGGRAASVRPGGRMSEVEVQIEI